MLLFLFLFLRSFYFSEEFFVLYVDIMCLFSQKERKKIPCAELVQINNSFHANWHYLNAQGKKTEKQFGIFDIKHFCWIQNHFRRLRPKTGPRYLQNLLSTPSTWGRLLYISGRMIDWGIGLKGMLIRSGLFYTETPGNRVDCTLTFFLLFLKSYFTYSYMISSIYI